MFKLKRAAIPFIVLALMLSTISVTAAEITVDPTTQFCFSSDDFTASEADDGVFITAVPSSNIAKIRYGDRILKAGDALPADALNELTLETACVTVQTAAVEYCTVADGKVTGMRSLKMSIRPKANEAPVAEDSQFETYKNIANTGTLKASDPEGRALSYTLEDSPKRGNVEIHEDGTFSYTPKKNKVGKDSFTFTVTDDAGNTSSPAKVSVEILRPTDKTTYADMSEDPAQFTALWLKENDIFCGSTIGGKLCFSPDHSVTRGDFLVMAMKLVGADQDLTVSTSGFADETDTPMWMQPYIATALSNGMISGTNTDTGVVFRPTDTITKAEAVVMLQNILNLPVSTMAPSSLDNEAVIPVWAADAYYALREAGMDIDLASEEDSLTRRDAASILYSAHELLQTQTISELYWLQ